MVHTVTTRPLPANEGGRGNLAGTALACTCGLEWGTSLTDPAVVAAEVREHLAGAAWLAAREAKRAKRAPASRPTCTGCAVCDPAEAARDEAAFDAAFAAD